MKTYVETTEAVIRKGNLLLEQRKKRRRIIGMVAGACAVVVAVVTSVFVFGNGGKPLNKYKIQSINVMAQGNESLFKASVVKNIDIITETNDMSVGMTNSVNFNGNVYSGNYSSTIHNGLNAEIIDRFVDNDSNTILYNRFDDTWAGIELSEDDVHIGEFKTEEELFEKTDELAAEYIDISMYNKSVNTNVTSYADGIIRKPVKGLYLPKEGEFVDYTVVYSYEVNGLKTEESIRIAILGGNVKGFYVNSLGKFSSSTEKFELENAEIDNVITDFVNSNVVIDKKDVEFEIEDSVLYKTGDGKYAIVSNVNCNYNIANREYNSMKNIVIEFE